VVTKAAADQIQEWNRVYQDMAPGRAPHGLFGSLQSCRLLARSLTSTRRAVRAKWRSARARTCASPWLLVLRAIVGEHGL